LYVKTDTSNDTVDEPNETFSLTATLNSLGTDYSDIGKATILDDDTPPVANNVTASGPEKTTIEVTLSGTDADGTVAAYTLTSLPNGGTLYTDAALTLEAETGTGYTSNTFYFAADQQLHSDGDHIPESFTYIVTDNGGNESEPAATATINVCDTAPFAINDYDQTDRYGMAEGNVITDVENDGGEDTLGADLPTLVTKVSHGSVSIIPDANGETIVGDYGKLTIKSDGDYSYVRIGVDSPGGPSTEKDVFNYTITDLDGSFDEAALEIDSYGDFIRSLDDPSHPANS
jgi:hypothetical protein